MVRLRETGKLNILAGEYVFQFQNGAIESLCLNYNLPDLHCFNSKMVRLRAVNNDNLKAITP